VAEPLLRAALTGLAETVRLEQSDDLPRLEDRQAAHGSGDLDGAHVDELGLQRRLAILEQHLDDLAQVLLQLVDVGALAVGARPARHVADKQTAIGVTLYDAVVRTCYRETSTLRAAHNPRAERFRLSQRCGASG
jgi:hypothetical protein